MIVNNCQSFKNILVAWYQLNQTALIKTLAKKKLDNHWRNHECKYDHTARIVTTRPDLDMQSKQDNDVNMELVTGLVKASSRSHL